MKIRGLLLDLDDTLYDYGPCEAAGRAALGQLAMDRLGISREEFVQRYDQARRSVKERCDSPSGHSRLLYLHEFLHALQRTATPPLHLAVAWERAFWDAYLGAARVRPGALALMHDFRASGGRIAIVTDLTLWIQLRKLEHLGLLEHIDALVASEEVAVDKPARAPFELAAERLGLSLEVCAVIGDSDVKDGAGARALGIPFFLVRTPESNGGSTLEEIHQKIARSHECTT